MGDRTMKSLTKTQTYALATALWLVLTPFAHAETGGHYKSHSTGPYGPSNPITVSPTTTDRNNNKVTVSPTITDRNNNNVTVAPTITDRNNNNVTVSPTTSSTSTASSDSRSSASNGNQYQIGGDGIGNTTSSQQPYSDGHLFAYPNGFGGYSILVEPSENDLKRLYPEQYPEPQVPIGGPTLGPTEPPVPGYETKDGIFHTTATNAEAAAKQAQIDGGF
jgi:hypothetical protein